MLSGEKEVTQKAGLVSMAKGGSAFEGCGALGCWKNKTKAPCCKTQERSLDGDDSDLCSGFFTPYPLWTL